MNPKRPSKASIHYSPLRYPGGKNCIFSFVASMFYENNIIGTSYAEPYAGGAGLALRLLFEGYVDQIYINDLDKSIYSFWFSIINNTDKFCSWLEDVDISIETWKEYRQIYQECEITNSIDIELAKATFYLNRTNVSGVIKGGVIGGIEQKGKYKIDARFNKPALIKRIEKIAEMKHRINLSNLDGLSFVNNINKTRKDVFIYLDPPYYQKGSELYMNFYKKDDHSDLARHVDKIRNKWMVSYDNHDFIISLYKKHKKILYKLSQSTSNRVGDEVLVFSDGIDIDESVNKLKSPTLLFM